MGEKCPYSEFFWFIFSLIRIDLLRITLYAVRLRENADQMCPNKDTFHTVHVTFRKESVKSSSPPKEIWKSKYEVIHSFSSVWFCKKSILCSCSHSNAGSHPQVLWKCLLWQHLIKFWKTFLVNFWCEEICNSSAGQRHI